MLECSLYRHVHRLGRIKGGDEEAHGETLVIRSADDVIYAMRVGALCEVELLLTEDVQRGTFHSICGHHGVAVIEKHEPSLDVVCTHVEIVTFGC